METTTEPPNSAPRAASEATPAVEMIDVTRRFGSVTALAGIGLTVRRGEFFSLLGPSGCGKTTLLRLIAGLELPDSGVVRIGGKEVNGVPAHLRPVNTVFQSYALFPHLNVGDNIAFGLRMKKVAAREIGRRVAAVLEVMQIAALSKRFPAQLSGGQKQRVALGRAMINEPEVLLLDEPLGALDLKLRKQLQVELHAMQRRSGMTFVYVTHDQEEALVMSDRIAVMNDGRIEQLGGTQEVYERPRTRFVAQFLGSCNLIAATVEREGEGVLVAKTKLGPMRVRRNPTHCADAVGASCTLAIRPEKIRLLAPAETAEPNTFRAQVQDLVYTGSETQCRLASAGVEFTAQALNSAAGGPTIKIGDEFAVHFPPDGMSVLDD